MTMILLLVTLLLLHSSTIHSFSTKPTQFQQFVFGSNGVCLEPSLFVDIESNRKFTMRNVPGDGDCMFQAAALAAATSWGLGANMVLLRKIAKETRQVVASILESEGNLYIEQARLVSAKQLLKSAAQQEGVTPDEYLSLLRKEGSEGGLYGGGPELTVLSNVLRRPISIYELDTTTDSATTKDPCPRIVCLGVFGNPLFADPCQKISDSAILLNLQPGAYSWHLHILVVDTGAEKHACVLLPQTPI